MSTGYVLVTTKDSPIYSGNSMPTSSVCKRRKCQAGQLDLQFDGYQSYWNYAEKKGYSGTAVFTRLQPISVSYGMDRTEHDREGRIITLEMEDFFLVNVYTPNSQEGLKRLEYRMTWEDDFLHFLKQLKTQKPVIVCGDLNVAHQEIDLKNPKTNRKNAGFTDEERYKFTQLLSAGFTDTFRYFYPNQKDIYSWWSYRFKAREKNAGWRIDYFLASAFAQREIVQCENTHGNFRLGPLSRGVGNRFIIIHIPLNNFSNDSECRIYYLPPVAEYRPPKGYNRPGVCSSIEIFQLDTVSLRNGVHRVS